MAFNRGLTFINKVQFSALFILILINYFIRQLTLKDNFLGRNNIIFFVLNQQTVPRSLKVIIFLNEKEHNRTKQVDE